jgi:hypothetical protein
MKITLAKLVEQCYITLMNNNTVSIERIHSFLAIRIDGFITTHILRRTPGRTIWTIERYPDGARVSMHYSYKDAEAWALSMPESASIDEIAADIEALG